MKYLLILSIILSIALVIVATVAFMVFDKAIYESPEGKCLRRMAIEFCSAKGLVPKYNTWVSFGGFGCNEERTGQRYHFNFLESEIKECRKAR